MDTVFQILFILIMSIGILGLPLYFYLIARRNRIVNGFSQDKDDDSSDENNEDIIDNE